MKIFARWCSTFFFESKKFVLSNFEEFKSISLKTFRFSLKLSPLPETFIPTSRTTIRFTNSLFLRQRFIKTRPPRLSPIITENSLIIFSVLKKTKHSSSFLVIKSSPTATLNSKVSHVIYDESEIGIRIGSNHKTRIYILVHWFLTFNNAQTL